MQEDNIKQKIDTTVAMMQRAGTPMSEKDKHDLERILTGEISFEDFIDPIIQAELNDGAPDIDIFSGTDEADQELDRRIREGIKIVLREKKRLGFPTTGYDKESKKAWLEWPDGHKEYI